jgi:hypothetical protein
MTTQRLGVIMNGVTGANGAGSTSLQSRCEE